MIVVNLFGGPGTGKSTTAAGLFFKLKNEGINTELAGEYAKDLVWSGRQKTLQDQLYVFGKQHHRIYRLKDSVDVVVMDSPILLGLAYSSHYPDCFFKTVKWAFDQYDNINFFLTRTKPYSIWGRNQTEQESLEKSAEIYDLLRDNQVNCTIHEANEQGLEDIFNIVMNKINKK